MSVHKCIYVYGQGPARRVFCTGQAIPLDDERAKYQWRYVTCRACKALRKKK